MLEAQARGLAVDVECAAKRRVASVAQSRGECVTAEHDKGRGEYVLNGKKYWPCNAGGWDLKGADVNVVIVRTDPTKGGKEGLSAILVPRDAGGVSYEQPISKIGHRLCQNNAMTFENCRVPEENLFLITTQAKRNLSSRSGIGGVLSAT